MRILSILFWLVVLCLFAGSVALGYACLSTAPLVGEAPPLTPSSVERAKALLAEHDVRRMKNNDVKTIVVSAEELTLLSNHLIQRLGDGGVDIELDAEEFNLLATLGLEGLRDRRYINIDLAFVSDAGKPKLRRLKVGKVSFPPCIAEALLRIGVLHLLRSAGIADNERVIQDVRLAERQLAVTYQWKTAIADAVREQLLSRDDVLRLEAYNEYLVTTLANANSRLPLVDLVGDVFAHAARRSQGGDPVAENRMALIALGAYINGSRLSSLIPAASSWPKAKRVRVIIHRRYDLARHFIISAALAVAGGGAAADAVGLYKEIDDADGGSGFSFKDLAADRAGTRFAQAATRSAQAARAVQTTCVEGLVAVDLVPELSGLEENLSETEFAKRYGEVGSDAYRAVVETIDRRIAASRLYSG